MDKPRPKLRRVIRSGRLPPEEVVKDEEIRRKVQEEFPPACRAAEPLPGGLSETLKQAIRASDQSVYQIAKEAGISQIVITRFLSGERDIRMATADRLAGVLKLRLTTGR